MSSISLGVAGYELDVTDHIWKLMCIMYTDDRGQPSVPLGYIAMDMRFIPTKASNDLAQIARLLQPCYWMVWLIGDCDLLNMSFWSIRQYSQTCASSNGGIMCCY